MSNEGSSIESAPLLGGTGRSSGADAGPSLPSSIVVVRSVPGLRDVSHVSCERDGGCSKRVI